MNYVLRLLRLFSFSGCPRVFRIKEQFFQKIMPMFVINNWYDSLFSLSLSLSLSLSPYQTPKGCLASLPDGTHNNDECPIPISLKAAP
jgi:hypothetical protein